MMAHGRQCPSVARRPGVWRPCRNVVKGTRAKSQSRQEPSQVAPLADAIIERGCRMNESAFHVPGHKRGARASKTQEQVLGETALANDATELQGLDNLQQPSGVIQEAMNLASRLWESEYTWFLVNGATVGIQASVMATCHRGKQDCIVMARNAHMSAHNAVALAGCTPLYVSPYCSNDMAHHVEPEALEEGFKEAIRRGLTPRAALIVSPTYFGVRSDIEALHHICQNYNSLLIVDEAHGAHLRFLPEGNGKDALQSGAELVVQSTHKQLGSLTQSSMLHAQHIDTDIKFRVERMLSILQSSSPSYLLMGSLDAARAQMEDPEVIQEPHQAATYLRACFKTIQNKYEATTSYLSLLDMTGAGNACMMDPWRFTVMLHDSMISTTGWSLSNLLEQEKGIVAEMATRNSIVFACGIGTTMKHAQALSEGFDWFMEAHHGSFEANRISTADQINHQSSNIKIHSMMGASIPEMLPSSVLFGNSRICMVPFQTSHGQIAAELVCPYPPGIPIILPGDCITGDQIEYIQYVLRAGGYITGSTDASMQQIAIVQHDGI
eukprot:jgi/Picsp_1/3841/NSC_01353-R1_arginine decarboxylase